MSNLTGWTKISVSKFKWTILGQQVLVSPTVLPEIFSKLDKKSLPKYIHKYLKLGGLEIPFNTDSWDGYPKERDKLFEILSKSQSNIILTGDTHNSWLSNLFNNNRVSWCRDSHTFDIFTKYNRYIWYNN